MDKETYGEEERFPPVLTKSDFVERFIAGEFGNKIPSWGAIEDFLDEEPPNHAGNYGLRNRQVGRGVYYNLSWTELVHTWKTVDYPSQWYGSQMLPHEGHTLVNAEVMRTETGLYLYYSTVQEPMRPSLQKGGQHAWGLTALMLLQGFLCPNSMSWLNLLLDRYPNHVVELTASDMFFGSLPNYNSIFWEVRLY